MPTFKEIPQMTRSAPYAVDVSWAFLPDHYYTSVAEYGLDVYPDFQRSYVWTSEQKVRYVEYILRGGHSGRDIYCNCPTWNKMLDAKDYVLVDGRQRLDAVLSFLNNEFPIFGGHFRRDYTDRPGILNAAFRWHVNDLSTRDEVLQWYVDLNAGGTIHSPEEIDRVRGLIGQGSSDPLSPEDVRRHAGMDRNIFQDLVQKMQQKEAEKKAAPPVPTKTPRGRR